MNLPFRLKPVSAWFVFFLVTGGAHAHIGSPNVFFEGHAGPYPVRIIVRPPGVIPGLAEVSVRVATNGVTSVSALPIRWNTGRQGAPPPDDAAPIRGETNLYNVQLWFMQGGAQSVEVAVTGVAGTGSVIVPVNATATRVLEMPRQLGTVLALLGAALVLLLATLVGAAVRESVLPAGGVPTSKRRWLARGAFVAAVLVISGLLAYGKTWWDSEAGNYRNNRLYHPMTISVATRTDNGGRNLRLQMVDDRFRFTSPLVPDHGKLMHLFLVREPGLDAFAHLHPIKIDWQTFDVRLPELPAGLYRLYADVTYETGFSDTLTTTVTIPGAEDAVRTVRGDSDPDDGWRMGGGSIESADSSRANRSVLSPDYSMDWLRQETLAANHDVQLRFVVRDRAGRAVRLEPYMGMVGHLILRRDDGSVFTHLHPSGSYSMAAKQLFELRAEGNLPLRVAGAMNDPICKLPTVIESQAAWLSANPPDAGQAISFPYAFPKSGKYRLWVQVKINGEVRTGEFDAMVLAP